MTESEQERPADAAARGQPIDRRRLGGTEKDQQRSTRHEDKRPPVSSSELSAGYSALTEDRGPRVNWVVFLVAAAAILAFSIYAMTAPDHARETMHGIVQWISANLGWYYVLTVTLVIGFVLWVALSKQGSVRLGPDHSRPEYRFFTWLAMLFAAGVGIDMLFYSVTGPVTQFIHPIDGDPRSLEAAEESVVWTMFHYGIAGWSMYSLIGMALGYFAYRWGMPLSIRAALYPLLGKRVRGGTGDVIDIFALVGTVFGVATSMGIGVVLLSVGFSTLFGIPDGLGLQIALIVVAVLLTIAACTSGVDKGIRIISELNIWSAAAMLVYILIFGQSAFLMNGIVQNIGRFVFTLPERTLQTMGYNPEGAEWMGSWTLFFWAFWLAWGPFVGLFLARISRGRTLREFVLAAITAPVLCDFLIVTIFGNSALHEVMVNGNEEFAQLSMDSPEQGWYALLEMFPGSTFLIGLATLSGLLFYLTSANSGAMVMSNYSSTIPDPADDGPKWLRIFWAVLTAILTIAMLIAGGVVTMEYATLIFALPVTIVAYLIMASFMKALRMEKADREGRELRRSNMAASGGTAPERSWRQRLANLRSYPSRHQVSEFVTAAVQPALSDVAREFENQGYTASMAVHELTEHGIPSSSIEVDMGDHRPFRYEVAAIESTVPVVGGRMAQKPERYFRLEVFTHTGSEGYDLMGVTRQQIIDDVLDRFESHLGFLDYSTMHATASVLTPPQETDPASDLTAVPGDLPGPQPDSSLVTMPSPDARPGDRLP
ncbi:choline BCCT transporter BetT [Kocuria palustris]|uniref:choline BCCT transporter BetT n=1 Tax=Kocuria palustris TaxID=71999 RepID=UPI0011A5EC35|nr:choline BCCT transporter BetT [Kocuria palustris]